MKFCIFLGNNFEDVEALTVIDVLRRAKVPVHIYGVGDNRIMSRSSVIYMTEFIFKNFQSLHVREYDGILLPGGPAVEELLKNEELINVIKYFHGLKKLIFAICAAPKLLDKAGVLAGKKYTCFPGTDIKNGTHVDEKVVVDGNVITSQGVGTSLEAAIKLIEVIVSKEEAENQAKRVLFGK